MWCKHNFYMRWKTKKIHVTRSLAIFALLQWFGTEPTLSLKCACRYAERSQDKRPCSWIAGEKYCPSPWDPPPWGLLPHLLLGSRRCPCALPTNPPCSFKIILIVLDKDTPAYSLSICHWTPLRDSVCFS